MSREHSAGGDRNDDGFDDNDNSNTNNNEITEEPPPPVLKTWKNLYILVLANLLFWIALFTFFTWTFQ